jgi:3'(2'), 5'-bisphosphate nucleotidase
MVSEEGVASQIDSETFWLIDPLDGTKEFLAHNSEFTVNIALIHKEEPLLGMVFAPALQCLFYGGQGIGAFEQKNKTALFEAQDGIAAGRPAEG